MNGKGQLKKVWDGLWSNAAAWALNVEGSFGDEVDSSSESARTQLSGRLPSAGVYVKTWTSDRQEKSTFSRASLFVTFQEGTPTTLYGIWSMRMLSSSCRWDSLLSL